MLLMLALVLSEDPSSHLGRFEKDLASQQTLMELLIGKMKKHGWICGPIQSPKDISQWNGTKLNANGEVTEILWSTRKLTGTIRLEWLPLTVARMDFERNRLKGTIDTSKLPASLKKLFFSECKMTGEFNLRYLPPQMDHVRARNNRLSGSVHLNNLPDSLRSLDLGSNSFSGTISLKHLPDGMGFLALNSNTLSGSIDVTRLPHCLYNLQLHENDFSGLTDFSELPRSLNRFSVDSTHLEGDLYGLRWKKFTAENSKVKIITFV